MLLQLILLFNWTDHVDAAITALICLIPAIYAWRKGFPQQTIQSLQQVNESDSNFIIRLQRDYGLLREECEGYKADMARLLREAKIHLDMEEADANTIKILDAETTALKTTIISLRRELSDVLRDTTERDNNAK